MVVLVFISLSVVSASDIGNDDTVSSSNADVQSAPITESSNNVLSDNSEVGTFSELNDLIQNSTTIDLTKDYNVVKLVNFDS